MSDETPKYRLDKTVFRGMTVEEADNYMRDYRNYSWKERLRVSFYLTSLAYGFDINTPPRMEKNIFSPSKNN